jgi:ketosteroid isomerase-like protein
MNTQEIAHDLVTLCQQGKFDLAGEKYWADDVLSVEAMGEEAESRGKQAARAKGEWWSNNHEVHDVKVEGPYVNGDEFTVRFVMDMTDKTNGQRMTMDEIALYRLRDGKIAEERFYYSM